MDAVLRTQECCYLSTPERARSWFGRLVYAYTDKGKLELSTVNLVFRGTRNRDLRIPLAAITEIQGAEFPKTFKPLGLACLDVSYASSGEVRRIYLVPTRSWRTPTWVTNKIVEEWREAVEQAHQAHGDAV